MPDLKRGHVSIHYEVTGNGPPLLLLAGMLSDSATWGPVLPLLEPHFTLIRPDNRTTGRTTPWNAPVTVNDMTDDALAVMDHLGHESFYIVGHSMGGLIGMELAGLHPDRVRSLIMLASAPTRIPRGMAVFDALLAIRQSGPQGEELWLRALYPWVFRPGFFDDPNTVADATAAAMAYPYQQTAQAMALQIKALGNYRPRTKPWDAKCPIRAVLAGHEILISNDLARETFAKMPNVDLHEIADSGHSIVWDAPDAVAEHILNFTKSL